MRILRLFVSRVDSVDEFFNAVYLNIGGILDASVFLPVSLLNETNKLMESGANRQSLNFSFRMTCSSLISMCVIPVAYSLSVIGASITFGLACGALIAHAVATFGASMIDRFENNSVQEQEFSEQVSVFCS